MEQPAKASVFPATDRSSWQALLLSSGVLIVLIVGSLMFGPVALTPGQVVTGLFAPAADPPAAAIVRNLRLPRVLLAVSAGALLGVAALLLGRLSGAQARDPGWSGVLALGALAAVILLVAAPASAGWALALAVGAGCGLGVAALVSAHRRWPLAPRRVMALGLALAIVAPAVAFILLIRDVRLATWVRWCLGSLEQRDWATWQQVWPVTLLALIALAVCHMRPRMPIALGIAATLAATSATLATGAIGLIGWLAGRRASLLSLSSGWQLVLAAIIGATFLLGADLIARGLTALLPSLGLISEAPVGAFLVVASLMVGAATFRRRRA
ncbi:MAG: iron chelate uptake ABC transporter family permease subunit [Oscillochloridaceae bacterium]|nr:iron chelate uptake ABC transporter family permease subunit [Chloroflexaceae bacterium]MDW8389663.1 iron chelate uptake ABC transporter family permease subunit [Oscillochloridaceae bacterium]